MTDTTDLDAAAASVMQTQTTTIRNNLFNAVPKNPATVAQHAQLATTLGIPLDSVASDPGMAKQQAAMQSFDASKVVSQYPHLAQFLTNQTNADKAHDDLPALAATEQAVRALPPALAQPDAPHATPSSTLSDALHYLVGAPDAQGQGNSFAGDLAGSAARGVAGIVSGMRLPLAAATLMRPFDAMLGDTRLQDSQFALQDQLSEFAKGGPGKDASFGRQLVGTVGSTASVLGVAALTGGASVAPRLGASVMEALGPHIAHGVQAMMLPSVAASNETYGSVMAQTGNVEDATKAALTSYVTSSLGGVVPFATPGKLAYRMGAGAAMGPLLGDVSHQAMNAAMPESMQQPDRTGEERGLDAVMGSIFGGMAGPHDIADINQRINAAARQSYVDAIKNEADAKSIEALHGLGQVSAVAKLRERDPAAFKAFVESVTDDGHLKEVYVDARVLTNALNQSGVTTADLQGTMPDVLAQLHEAGQTNGDVRIPVADYATHLAGTPIDDAILQHLKTDPEGKTYAEAQTFYQGQVESLKAAADTIISEQSDAAAARKERDAVRDQLLEKLNAVPQLHPGGNTHRAEVMSDFYVTQAARSGMKPEEFMKTYPLEYTGEPLADKGKTYDQAKAQGYDGHDHGEAAEWLAAKAKGLDMSPGARQQRAIDSGFLTTDKWQGVQDGVQRGRLGGEAQAGQDGRGDSRGSDADTGRLPASGQLQRFYHGTKDDVANFDPDHPNRKDAGWLGRGSYVTSNPDHAEIYSAQKRGEGAPRIMPLAIRLKNPFLADEQFKLKMSRLSPESVATVTEQLKAAGHDGVLLGVDPKTTEGVVFDPAAVRSENAAFDPDHKDSANILSQGVHPTDTPEFKTWFGDSPAEMRQRMPLDIQGEGSGGYSQTERNAAEAAGFDSTATWLHGTTKKFTGFKVGKGGVDELGPGVYFTKTPTYADAWSGGGRVEGGQTVRAFIKKGDLFDKSQKVDYLALAQRLKEKNPVTEGERRAREIRAAKDVTEWTAEESKVVNDASMEPWRSWLLESDADLAKQIERGAKAGGLNDWLSRAGYIGATNKNSQVPDQVVVFDPKNIRSPNAKFNPKKADSTNILHQPGDSNRGQISFGDDITQQASVISLLKNADLSTFLHESGHFFLEVQADLAKKIEARIADGAAVSEGERQILDDTNTALSWTGVKPGEGESHSTAWQRMTRDEKREHHETFARGFEAYALEGKSPSTALTRAFQAFRSWLLHVYKSMNALGVELTPEVRGVFDRMLASDESIKAAEQVRGYRPLFETAEAAGMTVTEFANYQQLGKDATADATDALQARRLRDMKWLGNAQSKALRDLQKQAAGKRREAQDQVTKEVMAEPVYQAQAFLNRPGNTDPAPGEADKAWRAQREEQHATNLAEVRKSTWENSDEAKAGENGLKKGQFLSKNKRAMDNEAERKTLEWEKNTPRPARAKAEFPPDLIAEMFGFATGKEMQAAIKASGSAKDKIASLTDQRMLEQHGDLVDQNAIERAAEASIHNEVRARFVATELKALSKAAGPAGQLALAAKEAADAAIAAKKVGDIRPTQYTAAEGRAGRAAEKALLAGDIATAANEKRAQLLNNRLAKAATDALDEVPKGLKYLRKFDKPTVAKAVGAEYMDRINELVSQYDITSRFNTKSDVQAREQFRDWLQSEASRTGVMPEVSDKLLDWTQQRHWKELSVEEFRGLVDAVKSLEHVGREQMLVTVNGQKVALAELVARAQADMASLPHSDPVDVQPHLQHARGLDKINAQWLSAKSKVRGMDAALLKMEQLFQWLTYGNKAGLGETRSGPFLEMFQRAGDAEGVERGMRADSAKDLRALGDALKDANIDLNEALTLPLARKGRGNQWYREEVLAAALNTGNEGNLKKMLEGYGWNERQLMDALNTHMSADEWKFVQGVWDSIGKYGPKISDLQKRLAGVSPEMVKSRTVHTNHGDFAGGYYPVVYDSFLDHNIETKQAKNTDMLFENQWARPTTSKGHTVNRTGYVGPVQLSLGVIPRHIDQVTHDLAWREAIIDINKFLSHDDIRTEVNQTMGREYTKQFRPWLQAMANDKVFNTAGDSAWESFYRKARTNTTIVGLGFRVSTIEIHGLSALSNSIGEVGVKWFAKGAAQFATPERWEASKQFMFERSAEMANRFNESDRNIHEAIDEINAHQKSLGTISAAQKLVDGTRKFAFYGVSALDMASAAPTWMGAYLKGLETGARGGLDMSEEAAVDFANRAVRNAHGGGGVKDLSAVQRDKGAMSMATMFYSFWNHMYNRQRDLLKGYANLPESFQNGTGTRDFAKLLARSWWYFVIPQMIHAALKPSNQKDQEEGMAGTIKHMAEEVGLGFVSGVPVLRDLANAAVNGRDYTITPLEQAGKSIVHATVDTYKAATGHETSKHAGKNLVQAAGYVAGLPTGQLSGTGSFLWDVMHGEQSPQDLHDWWQGVTNGRITH